MDDNQKDQEQNENTSKKQTAQTKDIKVKESNKNDSDKAGSPNEAEEKIEFLIGLVNQTINEYTLKRRKNRRPALVFKVLTTGLASVVTILLGIKVGNYMIEILNNIALIISALMTVISAWNTFFDYNELWVQYTATVDELELLKREIQYYRKGKLNLDIEDVDAFKNNYRAIVQEAADFLYQVRADDSKGKS